MKHEHDADDWMPVWLCNVLTLLTLPLWLPLFAWLDVRDWWRHRRG